MMMMDDGDKHDIIAIDNNIDKDKDDDDDVDEDDDDNVDHDNDIGDESMPFFGPTKMTPDDKVPYFAGTSSSRMKTVQPPAAIKMQLKMQNLFIHSKASLQLYDDVIELFNEYISSPEFNTFTKLKRQKALLTNTEVIYNCASLKPTNGTVTLHNNELATVPVFDITSMILSLVHDPRIMREENLQMV